MDETLKHYKDCGEGWKIAGITFPLRVLTGSSSYLVLLIVLLRLLAVKRPMDYGPIHKKVSRIGCILIWTISLLLPLLDFLLTLPSVYNSKVYGAAAGFQFLVFFIGPTFSTVIIYCLLLCNLNPETTISEATSSRMRGMAKMTRGIIIGLLVCNVPGIIFNIYLIMMILQGKTYETFSSTVAVRTSRQRLIVNYDFMEPYLNFSIF